MSALGRSKTAAYYVALREMRESHAALDVSLRLGYVPALGAALEDRMQRILATLYRLSFPCATARADMLRPGLCSALGCARKPGPRAAGESSHFLREFSPMKSH